MSFANLKRQSGNLDKLAKAVEALTQSSDNDKPDNFWKPSVDKSGNGMAVLRFLPAPSADGEDSLPWVKIHSHGFQGPTGSWLIDNCLTTKNQQCPVCEHNTALWNSGIEANKDIVRKQKRKLNYIANVYVVSDAANPQNEGKVFLFKFGKKIFDKITEAMNPEFQDETPINPFDLWKGANFKLKIRKVDGYQNYDKSEFESPAPLSNDDAELEKIYNSEYSLQELLNDPKEWKTYDQLKNRLDKVLGLGSEAPKTTVEKVKAENFSAPKKTVEDVEPAIHEDEDDMAYFAKLAEED
jgi:gp32 DNA binding protein like